MRWGYEHWSISQLWFLLFAATPPQNLCTNLQRGIRFHQAAGGHEVIVELLRNKNVYIFMHACFCGKPNNSTMINELKDFFDAIAFAANTTTLYVNFKSLKIRFPIFSVKAALNNTSDIERVIETLFYRKQVMWEHANYENAQWCMNSLKDLRNKCDSEAELFLSKSKTNDKNHFWATLLRTLGSYSDEAYKEIVKSNMTRQILDVILKKFRKNAYPIIATLLFSLPDGNATKHNGFKKLELGSKNSKLTIKQILPTWTIEP
jgi:hypothetical protein